MSRYQDSFFFKNRKVAKPLDFSFLEDVEFKTRRVAADEENRPDIIALKEYGDASLYYIILAANRKDSFRQIVTGMTIKIPLL